LSPFLKWWNYIQIEAEVIQEKKQVNCIGGLKGMWTFGTMKRGKETS
jgi:hypothetical protein